MNAMYMNLIIASVIFVIFAVTYRLYEHQYIALHPTRSLRCERVLEDIAHGPEDFALSKLHNVMFISSHNRRMMSSTGTIFAIDTSSGFPKEITISSMPKNFRPHGLAIFEDDTRCTLFVISHRLENELVHTIEEFDYDASSSSLLYVRTLSNPLLSSPNDLYAVGFDELLISNDHCVGSIFNQLAHDAIGHACAETIHFQEDKWVSLHDPVAFGNGIITTKAGVGGQEYMIRAAAASYQLYNYSMDKISNSAISLKLNYAETLPLSPDNIEYDEYSGGLLIAGHPSTTRFLMDALFEVPAPSAVILYFGQNNYEVLYYSDGHDMSASSVAVRTNETTYFIGQVFDSFVLRCTADPSPKDSFCTAA